MDGVGARPLAGLFPHESVGERRIAGSRKVRASGASQTGQLGGTHPTRPKRDCRRTLARAPPVREPGSHSAVQRAPPESASWAPSLRLVRDSDDRRERARLPGAPASGTKQPDRQALTMRRRARHALMPAGRRAEIGARGTSAPVASASA